MVELPTETIVKEYVLDVLRSDGDWVPISDVYRRVAIRLKLSDAQRAKMLNGENHFENRVRFARRKLVDAGLVDGSRRGFWKAI